MTVMATQRLPRTPLRPCVGHMALKYNTISVSPYGDGAPGSDAATRTHRLRIHLRLRVTKACRNGISCMIFRIKNAPRRAAIVLVQLYQTMLSPLTPSVCRYVPSCSQYAIEALSRYGAVKGSVLTLWRLLRCNPWGSRGYDPPRWFAEARPKSESDTL